jgi:hypothetical protein
MSAVNEGAIRQANPMLTCAQCALSFPAPPFRRGKVQIYCSSQCQTKAALLQEVEMFCIGHELRSPLST